MEEGVADGIEWEATIKRDLHHWGNLNWRSAGGSRGEEKDPRRKRERHAYPGIFVTGGAKSRATGGQSCIEGRIDPPRPMEEPHSCVSGPPSRPLSPREIAKPFEADTAKSPCGGFTILQSGREGTTNQPGYCPNHSFRKLLLLVYDVFIVSWTDSDELCERSLWGCKGLDELSCCNCDKWIKKWIILRV